MLQMTIYDNEAGLNVPREDFAEAFRLFTLDELKQLQINDYYFFRMDDGSNKIRYKALTISELKVYDDHVDIMAGGDSFFCVTGDDDRIIRMRSLSALTTFKHKHPCISENTDAIHY